MSDEPYDLAAATSSPPRGDDHAARDVTVTLSTVDPERVEWLWADRLPAGKLVTVDGDPGLGKSTVTITIAAHVSTGSPWPDRAPCPLGDVVIMSAEDGLADTIRPRLDAAGGDATRVHALTAVRQVDDDGQVTTRPPTLADINTLRALITRTGARLLIVDVLMAYLPSGTDSHRDQDIRTVLHRLAELADTTGCTVILVRHLNKSGGPNALYRGGGSIGIVGAARAGYIVAADPDSDDPSRRILACSKSNLAALPPSLAYRLIADPGRHVARVQWLGATTHTADALLDAPTGEERTERDDAAAWLDGWLTEHGGSGLARDATAAARARGYSKSTLHRASVTLGVRRTKDGLRGPWTWHHPDDTPPPQGPTRDVGLTSEDSEDPKISRDLETGTLGAEDPTNPPPVEPWDLRNLAWSSEETTRDLGEPPNNGHAATSHPDDSACERCGKPSSFGLIAGQCRTCHFNRQEIN